MNEVEKIKLINEVIADFFEHNKNENSIAAKELMPNFIKAGVFSKDHKKGLPIRKLLRALDEQNSLASIPSIHPERKDKNTVWYFLREGTEYISDSPNDTGLSKKKKANLNHASSDEHYVLNLCDEILKEEASRQHKFGFLLGDYHKDGKTRTALPVDGYYASLNLAIEFKKENTNDTDDPEKITISGVSRAEQRVIYDERRKKGLASNDIQFVQIDHAAFEFDENQKIIRDKEKDLSLLNSMLEKFK